MSPVIVPEILSEQLKIKTEEVNHCDTGTRLINFRDMEKNSQITPI